MKNTQFKDSYLFSFLLFFPFYIYIYLFWKKNHYIALIAWIVSKLRLQNNLNYKRYILKFSFLIFHSCPVLTYYDDDISLSGSIATRSISQWTYKYVWENNRKGICLGYPQALYVLSSWLPFYFCVFILVWQSAKLGPLLCIVKYPFISLRQV